MNDQKRIQIMKEYIESLERRLHRSEQMHEHAMEMVRKLIGKLK
jgi:hypothetical protein